VYFQLLFSDKRRRNLRGKLLDYSSTFTSQPSRFSLPCDSHNFCTNAMCANANVVSLYYARVTKNTANLHAIFVQNLSAILVRKNREGKTREIKNRDKRCRSVKRAFISHGQVQRYTYYILYYNYCLKFIVRKIVKRA